MHGIWILISVAVFAGVLVLTGIKLVKPRDIMHLRRFGWPPVIVYGISRPGRLETGRAPCQAVLLVRVARIYKVITTLSQVGNAQGGVVVELR